MTVCLVIFMTATGLLLMIETTDRMTGAFAVWAASKEAAFLHGHTVWSSWDVEELATGELRKRLDEDFYFLRQGIGGLNGIHLA
jgi:hypothetical protein